MRSRKTPAAILDQVLPPLASAYVRLVARTCRWDRIGQERFAALIATGEPFIVAFWHARILMMPMLRRELRTPFTAIVSAGRDGEVAARMLRRFGIETARGSSRDARKPHKDKRGADALRATIGAVRAGHVVGLCPDGPRGPAGQAQLGAAQLAGLTGLPVIPISYSAAWGRRLSSWDRFLLPLPFSRAVFAFGEPLTVPRGEGAAEEGRARIEAALHRVDAVADAHVGRPRLLLSEAPA